MNNTAVKDFIKSNLKNSDTLDYMDTIQPSGTISNSSKAMQTSEPLNRYYQSMLQFDETKVRGFLLRADKENPVEKEIFSRPFMDDLYLAYQYPFIGTQLLLSKTDLAGLQLSEHQLYEAIEMYYKNVPLDELIDMPLGDHSIGLKDAAVLCFPEKVSQYIKAYQMEEPVVIINRFGAAIFDLNEYPLDLLLQMRDDLNREDSLIYRIDEHTINFEKIEREYIQQLDAEYEPLGL